MNNQNYGVIGNAARPPSFTNRSPLYFFHSNHPAKFINR